MIILILQLAVVGIVVWLITTKLPLDPTIKIAIQIIVVVCVIVYLMQVFGFGDIPVPRVNK